MEQELHSTQPIQLYPVVLNGRIKNGEWIHPSLDEPDAISPGNLTLAVLGMG